MCTKLKKIEFKGIKSMNFFWKKLIINLFTYSASLEILKLKKCIFTNEDYLQISEAI